MRTLRSRRGRSWDQTADVSDVAGNIGTTGLVADKWVCQAPFAIRLCRLTLRGMPLMPSEHGANCLPRSYRLRPEPA
jgi:hypothetical protein